jgi:hypothetical protein
MKLRHLPWDFDSHMNLKRLAGWILRIIHEFTLHPWCFWHICYPTPPAVNNPVSIYAMISVREPVIYFMSWCVGSTTFYYSAASMQCQLPAPVSIGKIVIWQCYLECYNKIIHAFHVSHDKESVARHDMSMPRLTQAWSTQCRSSGPRQTKRCHP